MAVTSSPVEPLRSDPGPASGGGQWSTQAREFARIAVRPIGQALDRMSAAEVAAPGSPLVALLEQAHREGFTRLGVPRRLGGLGLSRDEECRVIEELAAADAAIASLLLASPVPFAWAAAAGSRELAAGLAEPYFSGRRTEWIGCWGAAEPAGRLRARRDADSWLLSGDTPPLPGAGIATHALLSCVAGEGSDRAVALVPLDARGISRRRASHGPGLRALCRAHLVLDAVRLPVDHVEQAPDACRPAPAGSARAAGGIVALAVGRAAYEGAARWAHEAMWARRPAPAGEQVHRHLLRMLGLLESAGAPARAAYLAPGQAAVPDTASLVDHARDARALAAAAAAEVTAAVARLCAADATPLGVPFLDGTRFDPDKLLRDAQAAYPTEGEHHGLRQDP
jgi:alkylation response protein AidB-like acyl-CoA dehydrogenase